MSSITDNELTKCKTLSCKFNMLKAKNIQDSFKAKAAAKQISATFTHTHVWSRFMLIFKTLTDRERKRSGEINFCLAQYNPDLIKFKIINTHRKTFKHT